jgi:hypothetical protein
MNPFRMYNPTQIIFGPAPSSLSELQIGSEELDRMAEEAVRSAPSRSSTRTM